MSCLDWSQCPAVESVPGRPGGKWVLAIPVCPSLRWFLNLAAGATIDEIVEQFDISKEEIEAVLEFAAHSSEAAPLPA